MRIAIIGAGWVGCHLAFKLKNDHDVHLYEKNNIFSGTSLVNQNRLHVGYHYPRNSKTRNMCRATFETFMKDYGTIVSDIENNIYCISEKESLLDFETYTKIFEGYEFSLANVDYLNNIGGAINVGEKYIDPIKASAFFNEQINDQLIIADIQSGDVEELSDNYDLVINCTNNQLRPIVENTFEEICDVFVYEKKYGIPFGALTFMDGKLFSIFPYLDGNFTVTDVEYTPSISLKNKEKQILIEQRVSNYYPDFLNAFSFLYSIKSLKVKNKDYSDGRTPVIKNTGNIIDCFTGKIQGIYAVEDHVRSICKS